MDVYHQSKAPEIYGGTISLIVLATIAVVARLAARRVSVANLWWDDLTIVLALIEILDWGLSSCYWIEIQYAGLGRHTVAAGGPVDEDDLVTYFKIFMAVQVLYFFTAVAIKTSLILLYYRIFGVIRWFRWVLAAALTIVLLYFIVCLLVAVLECQPVAFYWDKSIRGGTCIDQNQFYRWNGVANLLIDFMVWSLTLPVIWHLNLNLQQKLSLSVIFALGLLACAASIVRVVAFNQVNFDDITYTLVTASIWTTIEQSVGIICACLPTTKPLMGRLLANIKSSRKGHSDNTHETPTQGISLPTYKPRRSLGGSIDNSRTGFARLEDGNAVGAGSVTTNASRISGDDLPRVPDRIVKQQKLEQRVDEGTWLPDVELDPILRTHGGKF
ncbi:MAG: hypothetical protein Q9177_000206 [Variospora cf. flavescens]